MASLEQEVALAQTMLEQRLNAAGDNPAEVIAAHEAANRSLETISKLVQVMHKHDLATGEVLSKSALHRLMAKVIEKIAGRLEAFADHPAYAGTVDQIADDVEELIKQADNSEE
jgi:alkanesulfonate monooxygenase SsuD/methylene tetrahydromethanopterin reductase-like flavin-dependent oxidoreductase (luciferase family)